MIYRVRKERRATVDLVAAEETVVKRGSQAIKELLESQYVPPDSTWTMLVRHFVVLHCVFFFL